MVVVLVGSAGEATQRFAVRHCCAGRTKYYASYAIRGKKWKVRPCACKYAKRIRLVHRDKVIFDGYLCHVHRAKKIERERGRVGLIVKIYD